MQSKVMNRNNNSRNMPKPRPKNQTSRNQKKYSPKRRDSSSSEDEPVEIYEAPQGRDLDELIRTIFVTGDPDGVFVDILDLPETKEIYKKVFTAPSAAPVNNYEMYELMGDVHANGIIKWYMLRRYPFLQHPECVDIVAKLLITYGAKQSFYKIAQDLGFWKYISASVYDRQHSMKALLEDVFEAFIGATASIVDDNSDFQCYGVVYRILKNIFDGMSISLKYEDLTCPKTRLKETFDKFKNEIGQVI